MGASYKDAGVDINAGNELVKKIAPLARATSRTGVNVELGGFGGLFDLAACRFKDPVLVAANDGVGTKLKLAFATGKHDTVGIDLVAMCVNDLIVQGAEPLFFLDYFATGGLDNDVAGEVIAGIAEGCKQAGAALLGGETAEMPGMYAAGHYDLAGFAVGAVERDAILPRTDIAAGDVILGLASSGLHSNGFSLVRHVVEKNKLSYKDAAPFDTSRSLGEALLEPTRIYVKGLLEVLKAGHIKGLAHITGGGFTENIPRVLPDTLAAHIDCASFTTPAVFKWLAELGGIETAEMLRTFNCGVGMIAIVAPQQSEAVIQALAAQGQPACAIGTLTERGTEAVTYANVEALYQ